MLLFVSQFERMNQQARRNKPLEEFLDLCCFSLEDFVNAIRRRRRRARQCSLSVDGNLKRERKKANFDIEIIKLSRSCLNSTISRNGLKLWSERVNHDDHRSREQSEQ